MLWQKAVRQGVVSTELVNRSSWQPWGLFESKFDVFATFMVGLSFLGLGMDGVVGQGPSPLLKVGAALFALLGVALWWNLVRNALSLPILRACKKLHRHVIRQPGLYSLEDLMKMARATIEYKIRRVIELEAREGKESHEWQEFRKDVKHAYDASQAFRLLGNATIGGLYKEVQESMAKHELEDQRQMSV